METKHPSDVPGEQSNSQTVKQSSGVRSRSVYANIPMGCPLWVQTYFGSPDLAAERSSVRVLCISRGVTSPYSLIDDVRWVNPLKPPPTATLPLLAGTPNGGTVDRGSLERVVVAHRSCCGLGDSNFDFDGGDRCIFRRTRMLVKRTLSWNCFAQAG